MLYRYLAINMQGLRITGRMEAAHVEALEKRLRQMSLDLVRAKPVLRWWHFSGSGRMRLSRRERINFCFQLEQLLHAGVPLLEALTGLFTSSESPHVREIAGSLVNDIEGGQTFSQALSAHPLIFPPVFISQILAGEASGKLAEALENLCSALKWEDELIAHTQKLLAYPVFAAGILFFSCAFMMSYLVPELKHFAYGMGYELPFYARALFYLSDALALHGLFLLGLLFVGGTFFVLLIRQNFKARYAADYLKLRMPVLGQVLEKIILARLSDTFAMLYTTGVPVLDCLAVIRGAAGNQLFAKTLIHVENAIREGKSLSLAFAGAKLFPPFVIRMIAVGENTGALDKALKNVSYFYNRDVQESISRIHALIEPLITLLLGAFLAWVILSVISPVYDMMNQFRF